MRYLWFRRTFLAICVIVPATFALLFYRNKASTAEPPPLVPVVGATKTAALVLGNGDGDADPGDTIEYTVVINNTGPDPATGVTFADQLTGPQSLVNLSTQVSPIAVNDTFASIGN